MRTKVGAVHRDKSSDRMLLQILLAEQTGLRDEVARLSSAGAEPVVVLVEPDQMLATLLDQMSARDALLAVHSDDNGSVGWNVLYGTDSIGAQDVPRATDDSAFRAMSLSGFTQTCTGGRVVLRQSAAGLAS
ncbi:hypothetical protein H7J51_28040 [Mycobacterium crocinum]|uniref:Uncharacterized protein n=1 Tax=Mycolicibacterium crocinum TaxID=388459 RepID=A0ABY3TQ71_9MYCO|nr:hypothetical protein [Mycolicibacterium crocinum]MCV7219118.1 hypothetical protein [Mycolicibacterium crocinum]ULN43597.1 hypothetical protein MI149_11320 [Mycolicibacterium crocinum]